MSTKKYVTPSKLSVFLDNLKTTFASIVHKHTISDISDYTVDTELSSTSTNPVQNKTINDEFDAIADAMGTLELAIDDKANASHTHDDRYYTETEIDTKVSTINTAINGKANTSHGHAISDVTNLQSTLDSKAASSHSHTITASASDDDVVVLTGTNGTNKVTYSASHANSGVTAGTYKSVTVNAKGHVTAGSNPTTLSGYGITDAVSATTFDSHDSNTTKHITSTERTNWNAAKTHADSAHAPSNAEKNQNAFSNIAVSGQTTVAADTATDTVAFAGSNVSITTDANNDKVTFSVADGTTSTKGVVQLTNSTSSTSTTTAATPSSVKSAYDLANTAKTNAATAQSRADSAYTLAEGKADSLSDLGVTASATELNYMDGVTSNVQGQFDTSYYRANRFFPDVAMHNLVTDCLQINTAEDWTSNSGNRDGVIATEDASTITNCPVSSGAFYAYRTIRQVECTGRNPKTIVTLTEAYPVGGREWSRSYNPDTSSWSDWSCHDGACSHRDTGKSITDVVTNNIVYVCSPDRSTTKPICASEFTTGNGHNLTEKVSNSDIFKGVFNSGNIDELNTYGMYWAQFDKSSTSITGTQPPYVNTQYGYFEVLKAFKAGTDCMQRFTEYFGGYVHTRVYVNGGWLDWETNVVSSDLANYLPLSGGTLTGTLKVQNGSNGAVVLRSDGEGGNINIHSPSSYNSYWEIDAHNGDLRLYRNNGGTLECFNTFPITNGTLLNTSSVGDAAYKGVTDSTSTGGNIGTGTALTTERDVYNGLPTINGSHTYSANTNIYAPTSVGTNGYILMSSGSGAPSWIASTKLIEQEIQTTTVDIAQYGSLDTTLTATSYSRWTPIAAFLAYTPSSNMLCWKCYLSGTTIHLGLTCQHYATSGTVGITVLYIRTSI